MRGSVGRRIGKAFLGAVGACAFLAPAAGATTAYNTAPDDSWVTDGEVYAVAADDTHVFLGGHFSLVGPLTGSGTALDPATGGYDPAFAHVDGAVRAVVDDGADGFFIGGDFTRVGGVVRNGLAHIHADGTLDSGWSAETDRPVRALVRVGGRLFVGGQFTTIGGIAQPSLAAVDVATGGVVGDWRPAVNGNVNALAAAGTTGYAGGTIASVNGSARGFGAAFDVSTGALRAWDPHVEYQQIDALAVYGSQVYVGGEFSIAGDRSRYYLIRTDAATGTIDDSWNPNPSWPVYALLVSGSRLYVGGQFDTIAGATRGKAAAFDLPAGTLSSWDAQISTALGTYEPNVLSLAAVDTRILLGGSFTSVAGREQLRLAAVDATTGALDLSFDPRPNHHVYALAAAGGKVYAGGAFSSMNGMHRSGVAALFRSTGALDTSWQADAQGHGPVISALAVNNGTLYVGGQFDTIDGVARPNLAAVDAATGAVSTSFQSAASGICGSIVVAGGVLVVAQGWAELHGLDLATGAAVWSKFADDDIFDLAAVGGTVYVVGEFFHIDGVTRSMGAAVDAASGALLPWAPQIGNSTFAVAATTARVYIAGNFMNIGSVSRPGVAALDPTTGALDTGFSPPGINGTLFSIATDGASVFVGGSIIAVGGAERERLIELDPVTGALTSWYPRPDMTVRAITLTPDHMYVGGDIDNYSRTQHGFAAFGTTSADTTPPETTITSGPASTTASADATFTFESSEPASTFWCAVDGGSPYVACSSPFALHGVGVGSHVFRVYATDAAGNSDLSPAEWPWTVQGDTTPPDTSIDSGPSGTVTSTSATFAFSSTEAGSTFQCALDSGAAAACSSPVTYSGLAAGMHAFSVAARDAAGNVDPTPATRTWTVAVPTGPANDNFANAQALSGASGSLTGTNVGATLEAGEPQHAGVPNGASVWYAWTATGSGTTTIDTAGSNFDTVLAVYTGATLTGLTAVAANDDCCGGTTSQVSFAAAAGVTYRIAVAGYGGGTGSIALHWNGPSSSPPPPSNGPANDNFANAQTLTGASGSIRGTNVGATLEPGEPRHAGVPNGASVWYSWTPSASGSVTFSTSGSSFDTVLAVYRGSSLTALTAVAANDDASRHDVTSRVTFSAASGVTYRIAVAGYGSATGSISLGWK